MWSIIVIAVLTSSNLLLAAVLFRTRGTEAKYRASLLGKGEDLKFMADLRQHNDTLQRANEKLSDANRNLIRQNNARAA